MIAGGSLCGITLESIIKMKKLVLFFAGLLCVTAAFTQVVTKVSGTVSDMLSKKIAGASVRLLNTNSGALTGADGSFSIAEVFPGTYTLEVSAVGYATRTRKISAGANSMELSLNLQLAPSTLDEVVITAQKREELLQEVPVSTTALLSRQVEEYRLWNSKDLTAIVPNMYSADPGDRRNVSALRGIATTSYDPAVATYIDGVSQFNLDTYIAQLFDVERIEVLRGPQGTLYGRNAMAGVINIITRQPQNKSSGFAEITNGNYGLQRYSAGLRTPLIKNKLYLGIAGLYDQSNGYYTNDFNNTKFDRQKSITGNYYLKFLPDEGWAITLNVKHNNNRNHGTFPLVFGVDEALNNPFKLNQNATTQLVDNIFNASLSANHNAPGFNFTSQTAYQSNYRFYKEPIDGDFSPIDGITLINNYGRDWNRVEVFTQEFKFSSPATATGKFRWTAGTFYFHQDNPVKQATRFGEDAQMMGSPDKNYSLISSSKANSFGAAVYAQGTYALNSRLSLTAGIRYDKERRNQSVLGEYQQDPDPNPLFLYQPDTSAKVHFHAFSPKFTVGYQVTPDNLLFGNYSRGFRAGGLTPLSSDPSVPALFQYKPEYSNNFEIGAKNSLFNNRLLVNVTAFYSLVNDAQVPTLALPDAITITKNTGALKTRGVELETRGVMGGFLFDYNLGFTDAEFSDLKLSQNGSVVDLKGKNQIFTPNVTSMLAAQYGVLISKKHQLKLSVRGEWRYLGKQYFDLANTISQSSYNLLNTRVEISLPRFSLVLWGRNLADKKYISYAYDFGAVHLGDPKTYGITAKVKF